MGLMLMPASDTICVLSHWEIVRYLMLLAFPDVPALFHSKGVNMTRISAAGATRANSPVSAGVDLFDGASMRAAYCVREIEDAAAR